MNTLVIGADGRAHALAWALARSPDAGRVFVAPGNAGTAAEAGVANVAIGETDLDALADFVALRGIGLSVISPEVPLAAGVVDRLRLGGHAVFGPTQSAARLETSKAWARDFMARHEVPHPRFTVISSPEEAAHAIATLGGACVVKADGLAAGKGVVVCDSAEEAYAAVQAMLVEGVFGSAGARVLVEERLDGPELSVMAISDGRGYVLLPPAQDHKRLLDGDQGPNTGGMGAYAPAPLGSDALVDEVCRRVIEPTLAGMAEEGNPFTGCLFVGLMLTARGPVVIEFNARCGDPETEVQLPILDGVDLHALLLAAATGGLGERRDRLAVRGHACGVALASQGYPGKVSIDKVVRGLDSVAGRPGVHVFHAGTRLVGDEVLTSGGRVLYVVGVGESLTDAVAKAYGAIGPNGVSFDGMQYRRDIAAQALA